MLLTLGAMACDTSAQIVAVDPTPASLVIVVEATSPGQSPTSPTTLQLHVGQSATLSATALNSLGNPIGAVSVVWSSSAPGVAAVSGEGVVAAASPGTTDIDAEINGTKATISVEVTPA